MNYVRISFIEGQSLTSLGAVIKYVGIHTSLDSIFPQAEIVFSANDIDIIGRAIIKFGTELTIQVMDIKNSVVVSKNIFSVYKIETIDNYSPHSTCGTYKLHLVSKWYFKQIALSSIYKGPASKALLEILTREASIYYPHIYIRQSTTVQKTNWYRCQKTAAKFIEETLLPNYIIDDSPCYIYADDLGSIITDSILTMTQRKAGVVFVDPYIIKTVPPNENTKVILTGISNLAVDLGDEYAWQYQAQRLVVLTNKYNSVSGGVEPSNYYNPNFLPPSKLYAIEANIYADPRINTQTVFMDKAGNMAEMRASFLNNYRKKGYEAFKVRVEADNNYLVKVGSAVKIKLTSLPEGNPDDLEERLTAERLKFPTGMNENILSGKYYVKTLTRKFIPNASGIFMSQMLPTLIKVQ